MGIARSQTVTVDFSGALPTDAYGYTAGTAFNGEFSYDTKAPVGIPDINGVIFYQLALGAFTFHIGSDTLTDGDPEHLVKLEDDGGLQIYGTFMTGSGPLNGHSIVPDFTGSSDPSIQSLTLPTTFPTDFTSATVVSNYDFDSSFGSIKYAQVNIATAVPEPSTWAMVILGFCGVGFMAYRRKNGVFV
jgi:hypothetical protein